MRAIAVFRRRPDRLPPGVGRDLSRPAAELQMQPQVARCETPVNIEPVFTVQAVIGAAETALEKRLDMFAPERDQSAVALQNLGMRRAEIAR